MPDFEALIRDQQKHRSNSNDRLKVVQPIEIKERTESRHNNLLISNSLSLLTSLIGSAMGTLIVLVTYEKGWFNPDFLLGLIK